MAISALEVMAIFSIKDEATGVLKKIAEEARLLSKELKQISEGISTNFSTAFASIQTGIAAQMADVKLLDIEWKKVADTAASVGVFAARAAVPAMAAVPAGAARAPTAAAGVPNNLALASGLGGYGRGGIHGPRLAHGGGGGGVFGGGKMSFYAPVPAGATSGHVRGGLGLGLGGIGIYGGYEAFKVNDYIYKSLANAFPGRDQGTLHAQADELTGIITQNAITIGASPIDVAKMAADEIRNNPTISWDQRMEIMPTILKASAMEAYLKGLTNPEQAVTSFVSQLHQGGAFTPEKVEDYSKTLAFFNSKDPNSVVNIAKAEAYHVPIDTSMLNIPLEQELAAQTVLDQIGVGGKAGTWIRQMALKAAMPSHLIGDKKYAAAIERLQFMGLLDKSGSQSAWITDGQYDTQKMLHLMARKKQSLTNPKDIASFANDVTAVFGTRGASGVAPLINPNNLSRYDAMLAEAKEHKAFSLDEFWANANANNPMQRMRTTIVEAQVLLFQLGNTSLPVFTGALHSLKSTLDFLNPTSGTGAKADRDTEARLEAAGKWGLWGGIAGGIVGALGGPASPITVPGGMIIGGALGFGGGYGAEWMRQHSPAIPYLISPAHAEPAPPIPFSERWQDVPQIKSGEWPQKQSYNAIPPPRESKTIVVHTALNLDGATLATAVEQQIAELHEWPDSADTANGVAYPHIDGWNPGIG